MGRALPCQSEFSGVFAVVILGVLQFLVYKLLPVLKSTLGVMPLRGEVREAGRVDLENDVGRNGGIGSVAFTVNLFLALKKREPRSYWNNLQNVHREDFEQTSVGHMFVCFRFCCSRDTSRW